MKRIGNLIDRIIDRDNLSLAYVNARRGKSTTREAILFSQDMDQNLKGIADALRNGDVRYMDDMVVFGSSRKDLERVQQVVGVFLMERLSLNLKANSHINRTTCGLDFLGTRVFPSRINLNRRSRTRFSRRVRTLAKCWRIGVLNDIDFQKRLSAVVACSKRAGVKSWHWRKKLLQFCPEESH